MVSLLHAFENSPSDCSRILDVYWNEGKGASIEIRAGFPTEPRTFQEPSIFADTRSRECAIVRANATGAESVLCQQSSSHHASRALPKVEADARNYELVKGKSVISAVLH